MGPLMGRLRRPVLGSVYVAPRVSRLDCTFLTALMCPAPRLQHQPLHLPPSSPRLRLRCCPSRSQPHLPPVTGIPLPPHPTSLFCTYGRSQVLYRRTGKIPRKLPPFSPLSHPLPREGLEDHDPDRAKSNCQRHPWRFPTQGPSSFTLLPSLHPVLVPPLC